MVKHTVVYNGEPVEFTLIRKKVKNINLRIKADLSVVVSANKKVPLDIILDFVQTKADWIIDRQAKFSHRQQMRQPKEYVSGEEFRLLGKVLLLKVIESEIEELVQKGSYLELRVQLNAKFERKGQIVDNFFLEQARSAFNTSLAKMLAKVELDFVPTIQIKRMTSRWGSCLLHKKTVVLNLRLIHAPEACINYVVLHELLHFANPKHDQRFYNELTRVMPDWREYKRVLADF